MGVLLLVVRFWSAACDLIAGRIVDARAKPGDRFRPYLLWATPPLLLTSLAVFSVPSPSCCSSRTSATPRRREGERPQARRLPSEPMYFSGLTGLPDS